MEVQGRAAPGQMKHTGETAERIVSIFNENSRTAMEHVLQVLGTSQGEKSIPAAQLIASFLQKTKGLDAGEIGRWLSFDDALSSASLEALLNTYSFTGLKIDEALRLFLSNIRLPARLCAAETILLAFSRHFHRSDASLSVDTMVALCLSAHLLSMNLHSGVGSFDLEDESKEKRISRLRFVQHCQQLRPEEDDVIGDFAGRLYDAIELRAIHSDVRPSTDDRTRRQQKI